MQLPGLGAGPPPLRVASRSHCPPQIPLQAGSQLKGRHTSPATGEGGHSREWRRRKGGSHRSPMQHTPPPPHTWLVPWSPRDGPLRPHPTGSHQNPHPGQSFYWVLPLQPIHPSPQVPSACPRRGSPLGGAQEELHPWGTWDRPVGQQAERMGSPWLWSGPAPSPARPRLLP